MADFRSALLMLADEEFFELLRNYLGPIKTPFNKHDLIDRLERMLRNSETQEQIIRLIDTEDAEILTAVWLLGEPEAEEVFDFFSGRRSYMDTHHKLLNLEDRLLLYRDEGTLRVTPILKELLEQRVLQPGLLFRSRPVKEGEQPVRRPWFSDTLLASFLSFFVDEPEFFRADGQLRKRVSTRLKRLIPELVEPAGAGSETPHTRAAELLRSLAALGLLDAAAGTIAPDEAWTSFAQATSLERLSRLVGGWTAATSSHAGPQAGRMIPSVAEAVEAVVETLPAGVAVAPESIERLLSSLLSRRSAGRVRRIREAMTLFGLLLPMDDGFLAPAQIGQQGEGSVPLVVQPNFEVTVPQELPFADGLVIARLARLLKHDRYPRFELTKERLAATLRDGMSLQQIIDHLQAMSRSTVPQNVVVTLKSWSEEYESIRLFKGVVLTLEESRRFVAAQPAVAHYIQRELAPGVYLIAESDIGMVQEALGESGVELVPELATARSLVSESPVQSERQIDRRRLEGFSRLLQTPTTEPIQPVESSDLLEELHHALDNAAMNSEQRQEIAARIDRKLILTTEQIRPGSLRAEKSEARGLDYVGKVRIIEHAIRSGNSVLEVVERSEDGSPIRRLLEPGELQKETDELYLEGQELPDRNPVRLRVRKLGLVRRIRGGLLSRRPSP
jgi:hypothetical protein